MGKRVINLLAVLSLLVVPMTGAAVAQEAQPLSTGAVVGLRLVADGLDAPLSLKMPDDGTGRRFVVEQSGTIRIVTATGAQLAEPFLDVSDQLRPGGERGLLGLAFHPDFADNGRFFVYYSAPLREGGPEGFHHESHISEFSVSDDDPNVADPESERVLLVVDQPQGNHNGGDLTFGPDGYLYISLGDGGGANDNGFGHTPGLGNGQDITKLLGSILRIDVDSGDPYGIPPDNPFAGPGDPGADEIFAYGLRNPFRMGFDGDDLYVADVGQNRWEEVSIVERGGNYGWNRKEATDCFDPDNPNDPPATCTDVGPHGEPLIDPIIEYPQADLGGLGVAVIGGFVYRGNDLPGLRNRYVFGDFSGGGGEPGTLLTAQPRGRGLWHLQEIRVAGRPDGKVGENVRGFGMGVDGELYVLTEGDGDLAGHVYELVHPARPAARGSARVFVTQMSGDEENPPVATRARGVASFTLSRDGTQIDYRVNVNTIDDVLMAHIHVGPPGVNGGVVVWLYPDAPPPMLIPGTTNGTLATGTITADDLVGSLAGASIAQLHALMVAGQTYVNVHTTAHPGGEIRGQL